MTGAVLNEFFKSLVQGGFISLQALAAAPRLRLLSHNFNPSPSLDPTTLVECAFPGYAASAVDLTTVTGVVDPITGDMVCPIPQAANGNVFVSTGGAPQESVSGFVLTTDNGAFTTVNTILVGAFDVQPLLQYNLDSAIVPGYQIRVPTGGVLTVIDDN